MGHMCHLLASQPSGIAATAGQRRRLHGTLQKKHRQLIETTYEPELGSRADEVFIRYAGQGGLTRRQRYPRQLFGSGSALRVCSGRRSDPAAQKEVPRSSVTLNTERPRTPSRPRNSTVPSAPTTMTSSAPLHR